MEIDVREARAFLVLSQQLSFTRAAAYLGVSQSGLSQMISRLEKRLTFVLFDRTRHSVELTPAGKALLPEARRLVDAEDALREVTRSIQQGDVTRMRSLRIGAATTILMGMLPEIIDGLPGIVPVIRQMSESEQEQAFAQGDLDVGLQRTFNAGEGFIQVAHERLYVACRAGHQLAELPSAALRRFAGDRFLIFRREIAPVAYDSIVASIRRSGARFPVVHNYTDEGDFLGLVACGAGIGIVPECMTRVTMPRIRFVRIDDPQSVTPLAVRYTVTSERARSAAEQLAERARELIVD